MNSIDRMIVRNLIRAELDAERAETARKLHTLEDELREQFAAIIGELDQRVTTVHGHALRALTRQINGRKPTA